VPRVPRADVVFSAYDLGEHTNFAPASHVKEEYRLRKGVTVVPWETGIILCIELLVCLFNLLVFCLNVGSISRYSWGPQIL
jgi:hypothetical protein